MKKISRLSAAGIFSVKIENASSQSIAIPIFVSFRPSQIGAAMERLTAKSSFYNPT
jgi:hypothetical protein